MHKNHTCIVFYVVGKMYIYVFTFRVQILSIYCKIRQFSWTKVSSYCMIHTGSILVSKHMCTIVVLKFYIQNSKCFIWCFNYVSFQSQFVHNLRVYEMKGAWTKHNRNVLIGLYDSYQKAQSLRRNLAADALKAFKVEGGATTVSLELFIKSLLKFCSWSDSWINLIFCKLLCIA